VAVHSARLKEVRGASRRETEGVRRGMIHHAPTLPPKSGGQEVEKESGDSAGGFVSLYTLHNWIPASAGMAEESVRLRRTEGLGVSPNSPILPPRVGDQGG